MTVNALIAWLKLSKFVGNREVTIMCDCGRHQILEVNADLNGVYVEAKSNGAVYIEAKPK